MLLELLNVDLENSPSHVNCTFSNPTYLYKIVERGKFRLLSEEEK